MMMDQAIESVAEAIWSAGWPGTGREKPSTVQWADVRPPVRDRYVRMAWAAFNMAVEVIRIDSEELPDQPREGFDDCPVCQRVGRHCGGEHK